MLSIYPSLPPWETQCMFDFGTACVIWRQYSVNCMASRSPPPQFNWVDFIHFLFIYFFHSQCDSCSGFLLWETKTNEKKKKNIRWLLSFLSAVLCEQTITFWRNNKWLLGTTPWWYLFFQSINLMLSEIQVLLNQCQCQEMIRYMTAK